MTAQSISAIAKKYKVPPSLVRFAQIHEHNDAQAEAVFKQYAEQGFYADADSGSQWGEKKVSPPAPPKPAEKPTP